MVMSAISIMGGFFWTLFPATLILIQIQKRDPPRSYQKIWINYIGETKWGDTLQIYGQEDADGFSLYAENAHGRSIECQGK